MIGGFIIAWIAVVTLSIFFVLLVFICRAICNSDRKGGDRNQGVESGYTTAGSSNNNDWMYYSSSQTHGYNDSGIGIAHNYPETANHHVTINSHDNSGGVNSCHSGNTGGGGGDSGGVISCDSSNTGGGGGDSGGGCDSGGGGGDSGGGCDSGGGGGTTD